MDQILPLMLCIISVLADQEFELWRSAQVRRTIESEPQVSGRIVGGTDADIAHFPFQLSLRKFDLHICGASVVSSQYALTAAHCVSPVQCIDCIKLSGGSANRSQGVIFMVLKIIVHPTYNGHTYHNDVALIRIDGSFLEFENINIIGLHKNTISVSTLSPTYCTVTGWGQTNYLVDELPQTLKVVKIPLVSYVICRRKWSPYSVTTSMTCAGERRKDSCNGDSGGPLVCNNLLYGIVSWGDNECGSSYPGVYTSISADDVYTFLEQYI